VPETLTKNESTLSLIPTEVREDEFHERASATLDETSATMADARQGNALKAVNTEGP
jgi:hypothetical protein